jgi:phosphoglycolate phosphatase
VPIDALIFDLDGTLADSLPDIGAAMNAVLLANGLRPHPLLAYKVFVGEGALNLVRRAFHAAAPGTPELTGEEERLYLLQYQREYAALDHRGSTLYSGVEEMLDGVMAKRLPMAVLSNKRDDFAKHLAVRALDRWSFVEVRGEREGTPRKPDPTAALELAQRLGVLPKRIAFVGDTAIDVRTAKAAGMISVGVLWGFRGREELTKAGADHLIARPEGLLSLLA